MKKGLSFILLILLSLSTIVHAAEITQNKTTTQNKMDNNNVYTEDQLNILVTADKPEFTIKLKSNPTTGYSWFLRDYDGNVLTPINHDRLAPDRNLMGAPGYEIWTFKVKPSGFIVPQQTTIRLLYARPWQGADNSTQLVFRVTTQAKK